MENEEKLSKKVNKAGWFTFWLGLTAVVFSHGIKVFEKKPTRTYDFCLDDKGNVIEVEKDF